MRLYAGSFSTCCLTFTSASLQVGFSSWRNHNRSGFGPGRHGFEACTTTTSERFITDGSQCCSSCVCSESLHHQRPSSVPSLRRWKLRRQKNGTQRDLRKSSYLPIFPRV